MTLDYQTMIHLYSQLIWPLGRIGGFMLTVPIFSSVMIPRQIKILLAFSISWLCGQFIPAQFSLLYFDGMHLVYLAQELAFGVLMGFVLQLVFQVFVLAGQMISMQAGLGFAVMVDPSTKASMPLISQMYLMMVTLIFLSLNGHVALIEALVESFRVMPIGQLFQDQAMVWQVISFSGWVFKESVLVSMPAILSLLIVNMSFGIMSRVAPQLNIFSLGFPITLIMGFLVVRLGLPGLGQLIAARIDEGMHFILGMMH